MCNSIESVLQRSTEEVQAFLKPFTLVVAANLPEELLVKLADACDGMNLATTTTTTLPLVSVRAYGFLGTVRCQYTKHEVVESKPDATKPDLRIAQVSCTMYHAPCTCTTTRLTPRPFYNAHCSFYPTLRATLTPNR